MAMNELKETLRHTRCSQATLASKKFTSVLNLLFIIRLKTFLSKQSTAR